MHTQLFRAGAAQIDITPPPGTRINGDFITHYATFIHDDLYAKTLVLQDSGTTIALIIVDICSMPKDFLDDVKAQIERATGIPPSHILISSTHTHAAGSIADIHLGSLDVAYSKKLPGLIVASLTAALKNLEPAQVAFGAFDAPEHLLCRRYFMRDDYAPMNPVTGRQDQIKTNPFGAESHIESAVAPTDPQLGYLAVKSLDDRWISLLANYSLHYAGDWDNGTITADYFGVFANKIARNLNADQGFVGMMSNGTSGDVNIWDFLDENRYPRENFAKSRTIGEGLANRVVESLNALNWQTNPNLEVKYEELSLEVVKPNAEALEMAKETVSRAEFESIVLDHSAAGQAGLQQLYAREQILMNEFPEQQTVPIQLIQIGDGIIGGLAGEFFSETGLFLKSKIKPQCYFTIGLANGNVGYVPPASEIALGGYETWRCRYSCLVPEAEATIRERLVALSQQL